MEDLQEFQVDQPYAAKGEWLRDGSKPLPIYLIRNKNGLFVHSGSSTSPHYSVEDEVFQSVWSPNGKQLALNGLSTGLAVYKHPFWNGDDFSDHPTCLRLVKFPNSPQYPARSLRHIQWSPKGSFVVAHWQYDPKANSEGQDDRNVLVWNVATTASSSPTINNGASAASDSTTASSTTTTTTITDAQPVAAFSLKGVVMGQWPILKWRNDEKFCLLASRCEILIFDGHAIGGLPLMRLSSLSGVISTEPAPILTDSQTGVGPDGLIFAAFSPASSTADSDAIFRIVVIPEVRRNKGNGEDWSLAVQKPLGPSDSAEVSWSPSGTTVLVLASTTIDAAGENYGGVGDVYIARFDGSLTVKVNKAVAQEACWNPCRDEFIVIEGKSPSEIFLYDRDCNIQYEFPVAYRNTLRWDCFGSMVAVGGFGNLAGDLSFWYRDTEARCMKLVADWREPCTVMCGWSPDGRHFYTASTFPRMKVDNHFKVFDYEGNLLVAKSYPQLLDFQWKPEPSRKYDSPIPPTPQNSAIAAAKKFKTAKDLVCDVKDARRFGAGRGRKDVVTQNPVAPTTAQVAKLERNRQLDSISDWRAAPKEVSKESDSAPVNEEETQPEQSKRKTSTAKQKLEEKNVGTTTKSEPGVKDGGKSQIPVKNGSSSEHSKATASASSRVGPRRLVGSLTENENAQTPSELPQTITSSAALPIDGHEQPTSQKQPSTAQSVPLSHLTNDFVMASNGPIANGTTSRLPCRLLTKEALDINHLVNVDQAKHPTTSTQTSQLFMLNPHEQSSGQSASYPPQHRQSLQQLVTQSAPSNPKLFQDANAGGLLSLLKSILPPDASVHVGASARSQLTDGYESEFRSLNAVPSPVPHIAGSGRSLMLPSKISDPSQYAPPSTDNVESLVDLLFRAQKERSAAANAPSYPPPVYGNVGPYSNLENQFETRSVMTLPDRLNSQSMSEGLANAFEASQIYQQRVKNLSQNFEERGLALQQPNLHNMLNSQPDQLQEFQELQNRYKQARGDPRQQVSVLQELQNRISQTRPDLPLQQPVPESQYRLGDAAPQRPGTGHQLRPDPRKDRCWEYLDPRGTVQGPFHIEEMRQWHTLGYFDPSLPIRCIPGGLFTQLTRLFPPGTEPFKLS